MKLLPFYLSWDNALSASPPVEGIIIIVPLNPQVYNENEQPVKKNPNNKIDLADFFIIWSTVYICRYLVSPSGEEVYADLTQGYSRSLEYHLQSELISLIFPACFKNKLICRDNVVDGRTVAL